MGGLCSAGGVAAAASVLFTAASCKWGGQAGRVGRNSSGTVRCRLGVDCVSEKRVLARQILLCRAVTALDSTPRHYN